MCSCSPETTTRQHGKCGRTQIQPALTLDQLNLYGRSWFATYNTVGVRRALEDQVQAVLSGRAKPAHAARTAPQNANALLKPYVEHTALSLPQ